MKYIVFWEYCQEDEEKMIEMATKANEERDKNPDKYQKLLFPNHHILGTYKGFAIVEADKPEQIANWVQAAEGFLKYKYKPIMDSMDWLKLL